MKKESAMSIVGELNYFIGSQVKQSNDEIFSYQSKYAKNLVKKFGLKNSKHMKTPMGTNRNLSKYENKVLVDPTLYKSIIVNLIYLTVSILDIYFSIGVCARYQTNSKESHIATVKRIIRYVSGITNYDI